MLPTTYLLRFQVDGGAPSFEPILCQTDAEALTQARQQLEARPECELVEVYKGEASLFQVSRPEP